MIAKSHNVAPFILSYGFYWRILLHSSNAYCQRMSDFIEQFSL